MLKVADGCCLLDFEVTLKRNGLSIKTETRIKKRTVGVPEGLNSQLTSFGSSIQGLFRVCLVFI